MNFAMLIRIWSLPNQDPVLNQISYQGSINRGSCLDYAHCSIGHGIPNLSLRSFSSRKFCIDLSHFGFQLITPSQHFWHPSARCFERSQLPNWTDLYGRQSFQSRMHAPLLLLANLSRIEALFIKRQLDSPSSDEVWSLVIDSVLGSWFVATDLWSSTLRSEDDQSGPVFHRQCMSVSCFSQGKRLLCWLALNCSSTTAWSLAVRLGHPPPASSLNEVVHVQVG